MADSIEFVGGPVAGRQYSGPDLDHIAVPLNADLQHIVAGEPFALAGYKRKVADGVTKYHFLGIRRANGQPFPVEFADGPAQGMLPLKHPIQYCPQELPIPLNEKKEVFKDEGEPAAVALYERRETEGRLRYHFMRVETEGPLLEKVKEEIAANRLKQAIRNAYGNSRDEIYTTQPTDEHPQACIQVGHRRATVDERLAPLIQELWRLGFDTMGSCQERPSGNAYVGFQIQSQGDALFRSLSEAGFQPSVKPSKLTIGKSFAPDSTPKQKIEFDAVNVSFPSGDIERITDYLRGLKSMP